jgi:hypothetical protein
MSPVHTQDYIRSLITVYKTSLQNAFIKLALPACRVHSKPCEDDQDMNVHKVYQQIHTDFIEARHTSSVHAA